MTELDALCSSFLFSINWRGRSPTLTSHSKNKIKKSKIIDINGNKNYNNINNSYLFQTLICKVVVTEVEKPSACFNWFSNCLKILFLHLKKPSESQSKQALGIKSLIPTWFSVNNTHFQMVTISTGPV